jgi:dTDP-glucose pyrophosphorylase
MNEISKTNINDFDIICLNHDTNGQADTVYKATKEIANQELYIFNIDTILTNFIKHDLKDDEYGYLEVFKDKGSHWSFIENDAEKVTKVTEKIKISDLCSNGLYYFKNSDDFNKAFLNPNQNGNHSSEIYVAPLYNQLINEGKKITFKKVKKDEIIFSGTPEEYKNIPIKLINEYISKL